MPLVFSHNEGLYTLVGRPILAAAGFAAGWTSRKRVRGLKGRPTTSAASPVLGKLSGIEQACRRQNSTVIDTAGVRSMPRSKLEMYLPLRRNRNGSLLWEK